jgi:hypothetical protein
VAADGGFYGLLDPSYRLVGLSIIVDINKTVYVDDVTVAGTTVGEPSGR